MEQRRHTALFEPVDGPMAVETVFDIFTNLPTVACLGPYALAFLYSLLYRLVTETALLEFDSDPKCAAG